MLLSLMVAMDERGVIGRENRLPWRLTADMRRVKAATLGKPIIMGRKTHEAIGRPLPGRDNLVISRNKKYRSAGCLVFASLDAALDHCRDRPEVVIMGGAELYRQTLNRADRIYLTEVHATVAGDTFFPEFDRTLWREISREDFKADAQNEFDYSFVVLEKTA
jgi:dihydrofolate reductase